MSLPPVTFPVVYLISYTLGLLYTMNAASIFKTELKPENLDSSVWTNDTTDTRGAKWRLYKFL